MQILDFSVANGSTNNNGISGTKPHPRSGNNMKVVDYVALFT